MLYLVITAGVALLISAALFFQSGRYFEIPRSRGEAVTTLLGIALGGIGMSAATFAIENFIPFNWAVTVGIAYAVIFTTLGLLAWGLGRSDRFRYEVGEKRQDVYLVIDIQNDFSGGR